MLLVQVVLLGHAVSKIHSSEGQKVKITLNQRKLNQILRVELVSELLMLAF